MNKDEAVDTATDTVTAGAPSASTAESGSAIDPTSQFEKLVAELSLLDGKRSHIRHDERCGDETMVTPTEGAIEYTEFVCYCDCDELLRKSNEQLQTILQQTSDFADAYHIFNKEALKVHEQVGNLDRCYTVAQSLGLVETQLELLQKLKRFEEGAEVAIQHDYQYQQVTKHEYVQYFLEKLSDIPRLLRYAQEQHLDTLVVKTLLKMEDADGALKYAESKEMHDQALDILDTRPRIKEAVSYAERYALHDKALEMLIEYDCYEDLFEYGAKHDYQNVVMMESQKILENLLNEDNVQPTTIKARELCAAMEHHQLERSAALYHEVIDEFERRVTAKRSIWASEEELKEGRTRDDAWFDVADLELSLGNYDRYRKVWEKTKEIWQYEVRIHQNSMDKCRVNEESIPLAQSMLDNPRYHSHHEGLPKWRLPSQQLLWIAGPLAGLLEVENKNGEKKYPFISLESVINAWGTGGMCNFFECDLSPTAPQKYYELYFDESNSISMKEDIPTAIESVHSTEAFIFIVHNLICLYYTNWKATTTNDESLKNKTFNRIGELLEYALAETAQGGEKSARKTIALENILYVPVEQLTKENIFALETGGPDAVWKYVASHEKSSEASPLVDARLREIQQMYPRFDEATQQRMRQVFFDAYTSTEGIQSLDRALTLYMELKQAYGKPMIFPVDHPLHFLRALPRNESEKKSYAELVMKEIASVPKRRKQVAEAALGRQLHDFFESAFELYDKFPSVVGSEPIRKKEFIVDLDRTSALISNQVKKLELADKLAEFLAASPQQLDTYHQALKSVQDTPHLFFELDALAAGEHESLPRWTFLEHYDHFSSAILAERSSLFVPGSMAQYVLTTVRPQGKKPGIRERMLREVDAIAYLFREMYQIAQSQTFKGDADFRQTAVSSAVKLWREKQKEFLPPEVAETMAKFNFNRFFGGGDDAVQRYLETVKGRKVSTDSLFIEQPDILFSRILDLGYYLNPKSNGEKPVPNGEKSKYSDKKPKLSDEFINVINRLKKGLSTSWTFDEMRLEFNTDKLNDFFNNVAECTGNGGKYQRYGYGHMQDHNIGIIAANLYETEKYKTTVGKAFLARCQDQESKELLYVDGVVMLQDIADFLEEPNQEARWLPLYTKAILQTALTHQLDEIVFNASHKLAQRSVWQYIKHVAELLGFQEGKDFTYKEGPVDDGSKDKKTNIKTMSVKGFDFIDPAEQPYHHYVEKLSDESYRGLHLREGFWINHYDPKKVEARNAEIELLKSSLKMAASNEEKLEEENAQGTIEESLQEKIQELQGDIQRIPRTYSYVQPIDHSDTPQINDGKGYIIGFRRTTAELVRLFNKKYGEEYGHVPVTEV